MEKNLKYILSRISGFIDISLIAFLIYDFGFTANDSVKYYKSVTLLILTFALLIFNYVRWRLAKDNYIRNLFSANLAVLVIILLLSFGSFIAHDFNFFESQKKIKYLMEVGMLLYFILRLTNLIRKLYNYHYNPAILFVGSFALIGFVGALLLMLPNATYNGISFVDALFTSVSAVCVTGLIVLDTAKAFTPFGQTVILVIIQLGGIGMLTFTSFFAYFFKSGSSFSEGIYMKDFVGVDNLGNVLKTAMRVVLFTFGLECIGATIILYNVSGIEGLENKVFFSIFHSISAFCNAGFSTLSDGLKDEHIRYAYSFQWMIMVLIVFGGLGYGIVQNIYSYVKKAIINLFKPNEKTPTVRVITLNSKIVLVTTAILLIVGTVFIGILEYNSVLTDHDTLWGKFTTASFTSVTTRTAGFNTIDFNSLTVPGILFVILLMWIGASPGSTGGGIKTSTFALATLNIISIIRGKDNIEIGTRRVANDSVRRAFAIISISLIVIGISILLLHFYEKKFSLLEIAFEVFSAYSTVGLSLGITGNLSTPGKIVIIAVMFFGRIGLINLMIGMMRKVQTDFREYPKEKILIN